VVLQRFEPSGARIGDGVELSVAEEANALVNVAMASDGAKYLYCWSSQKKVHCGLFEPPAAHTPEIFEADGATVAVAFAGDTWLVAYLSANFEEAAPEFVLQALSRDGHAIAPARRLSVSNGPGHYEPILGAAGEEFVLIARNAAAEYRPHVYWLSPELADLRPPVDLGPLRPKQGVIAAVPGLVAASLSEAYMSYLTLVGPDGEVVTHEIPGGGKQGRLEAVSATPEGVVASWFLPDSRLHAQAFTSTRDAPGALEAADWQWLTFPAGNRLIGARLFSNFRWSTAVIEVVPLPEAL